MRYPTSGSAASSVKLKTIKVTGGRVVPQGAGGGLRGGDAGAGGEKLADAILPQSTLAETPVLENGT